MLPRPVLYPGGGPVGPAGVPGAGWGGRGGAWVDPLGTFVAVLAASYVTQLFCRVLVCLHVCLLVRVLV